MEFTELTLPEYTAFCDAGSQKNFMQTEMMYRFYDLQNENHWLVGVKEHDQVIAATLLIQHKEKFLGKYVFDTLQGPILDWDNDQLVSFFTKELKKFVSKRGGYRILIDPYIVSQTRDTNAEVVENGVNHLAVKEMLERNGYIYLDAYWQVKWIYCKDIDGMNENELLKSFQPSVRNHIHKTINKYQLNVRKLSYEELPEFQKITEETADRRGFHDRGLKYYQDMYQAFGDACAFYICELNLDHYIDRMNQENAEAQEKIQTLSDSISNQHKKTAARQLISSNEKAIAEAERIREERGKVLPLSAALFMLYGDESVYLFSGSDDHYMKFLGQYRIQWEILKYDAEHHYRRHNFYGILDVFNPNGKDHGVLEFKQGFNGYVEELLGTFEMPVTIVGRMYNWIEKVRHKR